RAAPSTTAAPAVPRPVPAPPVAAPTAPAVIAAAPVAVERPVVTTPTAAAAFAGSAEQASAAAMAKASRSADEVYQFLQPLEDRYAGDVDYDYRLGTSAFDSGRYSQAIFVLQRAVATRPGFDGARMELARAYFAQGDNESARREFAALDKANPPPDARRAIAEYLAAIDQRATAYESKLGGHAEFGTGYDSNANGAPSIQNFIGFQLDSRNQATASSYYSVGVGGLVSHPFAPGWRLLGTGNAGYRGNPDATFVDSQVLRLAGAVEWRPSEYEFSLQPNFALAMLDGEDNHQVIGVDLAGTRHFEQAQVSLNIRSGQTRYADGLETLDVDTLVYGVAGRYTSRSMPRMQYVGALTLGTDDAVEDGSPFGRDLTGVRAGVIVDFGGGHALLASIATLTAAYDGVFFGQDRDDDQLAGTLGYEWGGWRAVGWTVRGQLNYVDNSSSVALYDYDRIDAGLSIRKEFK
ncbi:MAG: tetratricopeptide repeat protein, partial [Arenimonas sp.]